MPFLDCDVAFYKPNSNGKLWQMRNEKWKMENGKWFLVATRPLTLRSGHVGFADVEIRGDLLYVVVVFQSFHQLQHLLGLSPL